MFRLIQTSTSVPFSMPVDPSAQFEPGMVGQLGLVGNNIIITTSDGTCPFGILDDIKKNSFSSVSQDESAIGFVPVGLRNITSGRIYSTADIIIELEHANINAALFVSRNLNVVLHASNGNIVIPSGTELNFSMAGNGIMDAFKTIVSYQYQIPNVPGDDSTASSGMATIWLDRMVAESSMYSTNRRYPVNHPLFVSSEGLLTTTPESSSSPSIGIVVAPPSALHGSLQFLWF